MRFGQLSFCNQQPLLCFFFASIFQGVLWEDEQRQVLVLPPPTAGPLLQLLSRFSSTGNEGVYTAQRGGGGGAATGTHLFLRLLRFLDQDLKGRRERQTMSWKKIGGANGGRKNRRDFSWETAGAVVAADTPPSLHWEKNTACGFKFKEKNSSKEPDFMSEFLTVLQHKAKLWASD